MTIFVIAASYHMDGCISILYVMMMTLSFLFPLSSQVKHLSDTIPKLRRCSISTSKELGLDGFDWNTFLHWLQKLDQKYIALLAEFWPCRLRDTALVVQVIYCLCVHLLYFLFLRIAGFFISLFVYGCNAYNLVMAWETLHWWTKRS